MPVSTVTRTLGCAAAMAIFAANSAAAGDAAVPAPVSMTPVSKEFGPVPSRLPSLANEAPGVITLLNDAQPVFGLPGTVVSSDISKRSHLTGDWGGARTKMTRDGLFLNLYSTTAFQNIGRGLKPTSNLVQQFHAVADVDTGRAGAWAGGLIHFAGHARFGASELRNMGAGSATPAFTAFTNPAVYSNGILATDYLLVQSLTQNFSVFVGKANSVYVPDQSMFGSSSKTDWASFNFSGANPLLLNVYGNVTWVGIGAWKINDNITILGGALDPNAKATNFATNAFNGVNLYTQVMFSYDLWGNPGQLMPIFNWSSKKLTDLNKPISNFGALLGAYAQYSTLEASRDHGGTPANPADFIAAAQPNNKRSSWMVLGNYAQYLHVIEDAETVKKKLASGQPVRGLGVQGRVGYGTPQTNFVSKHFSIALYGLGLADSRPLDRYGAGFYFNGISSGFKNNFSNAMRRGIGDEKGVEAFYTFAITPAITLGSSIQYIWNPTYGEIITGRRQASAFYEKLSIVW